MDKKKKPFDLFDRVTEKEKDRLEPQDKSTDYDLGDEEKVGFYRKQLNDYERMTENGLKKIKAYKKRIWAVMNQLGSKDEYLKIQLLSMYNLADKAAIPKLEDNLEEMIRYREEELEDLDDDEKAPEELEKRREEYERSDRGLRSTLDFFDDMAEMAEMSAGTYKR